MDAPNAAEMIAPRPAWGEWIEILRGDRGRAAVDTSPRMGRVD